MMMPGTIVYLHGFASVGNSAKSQRLVERFGKDMVVAPDLPMDPIDALDVIYEAVLHATESREDALPLVFVGTSLGGFYAQYMSAVFNAPAVLVNPATDPAKSLKPYVGNNTNYTTGKVFELTEDHLVQLELLRDAMVAFLCQEKLEVFLAKDDAVLPYTEALVDLPNAKSVKLYDDGGHRFEAHWDDVMDKIAELLKDV